MYEIETIESNENNDIADVQEDVTTTGSSDDLDFPDDTSSESPLQDSLETVEDSSEDSSGVHDSGGGDSGTGDVDLSAGDGEQTSEPVTDGDSGNTGSTRSDSSVGDTVYNYYMELGTDYTDALLSLQASFDTLNETLFLILVFLLLSWTEKKISLAVRKFTVERRR